MGKSFRDKWKKFSNTTKKSGNQKHRGNKELSLLENNYSEDDFDKTWENNKSDEFGNQIEK